MVEEPEKCSARIIHDWDYNDCQHPAKEGDEWVSVCIPYIGTYGCISQVVQEYLFEHQEEDVLQYVSDPSQYDAIKIDYDVDLDRYNESYVGRVRKMLNLSELHLECMSSPNEYNFTTDKLMAQITKNDMWKMYKSVKDTEFYKTIVEDAVTPCDGYMPYYREEDFYFSSPEDWSDGYDHPAILGTIMKAALHDKLDLDADAYGIEMELFMEQENWDPITGYISISSIKMYKEGEETEIEF